MFLICQVSPKSTGLYHHVTLWVGPPHSMSHSSSSRDIMVLVSQVIFQNHVIKKSCSLMDRRVTILPSLVAIGNVVVAI